MQSPSATSTEVQVVATPKRGSNLATSHSVTLASNENLVSSTVIAGASSATMTTAASQDSSGLGQSAVTTTQDPGTALAAPTSIDDAAATAATATTEPPKDPNKSAVIPIAIGVVMGTSILASAGSIVFLYFRKRRREAPARAESPPPYDSREMEARPSIEAAAWRMQGY